MWHCAAAFLAGREIFFRFQNFSALQMADFDGKSFDRRCNNAKRGEKLRMAITGNDLGRDWLYLSGPSSRQHAASTLGSILAKVPTAPGNRASGDFLPRARNQSFPIAFKFGISLCQFQTECYRFAMYAMAAADGRCKFVLIVPVFLLLLARLVNIGKQDMSEAFTNCTARQVSSTSLEVMPWCMNRASSPTFSATLVRKAITSCFTSRSISSIRATSNLPFAQIASAASFGNNAQFCQCIRRMRLNFKPDLEFRFRFPDSNHIGTGIARDHFCSLDNRELCGTVAAGFAAPLAAVE